jgi:ribosomal protein S18 acetylase RimI-like enzyme
LFDGSAHRRIVPHRRTNDASIGDTRVVTIEVRKMAPGDADLIVAAAGLFDRPPRHDWAQKFLSSADHHLVMAFDGDRAVGFVSGVETTHPDKGTEMFVYELGVDEPYRRRGIATALLAELRRIAVAAGCYGMWVGTEPDNTAAIATYRAAGFEPPEPTVTLAVTLGRHDS